MQKINKYIKRHLITILEDFSKTIQKDNPNLINSREQVKNEIPLDLFIHRYFKSNKKLGQQDRQQIQNLIYPTIKHKYLLDYIALRPVTWESRLEQLYTTDFKNSMKNENIKANVRCSQNNQLFQMLSDQYGEENAIQYSLQMLEKAPLFVRVNTQKIQRQQLMKIFNDLNFNPIECKFSPIGIQLLQNAKSLYELEEFEKGYFEIQDEGSQLVSLRLQAQPGQQILDFCSGSGGKALAIAQFMDGKGQIYLNDIRQKSITLAKQRFKRAEFQNVQFINSINKKSALKGKMDWIILDVPCSGTGTLRRNPDIKLKFTQEYLQQKIDSQKQIFEQSLPFLKKEGKIAYTTCSILQQVNYYFYQENEDQIEFFCKQYNLKKADNDFKILPQYQQMDSFYQSILQFK